MPEKREIMTEHKEIIISRGFGDGKIVLRIFDGVRIEEELLLNLEDAEELIKFLQEAIEQKYFTKYYNTISIN